MCVQDDTQTRASERTHTYTLWRQTSEGACPSQVNAVPRACCPLETVHACVCVCVRVCVCLDNASLTLLVECQNELRSRLLDHCGYTYMERLFAVAGLRDIVSTPQLPDWSGWLPQAGQAQGACAEAPCAAPAAAAQTGPVGADIQQAAVARRPSDTGQEYVYSAEGMPAEQGAAGVRGDAAHESNAHHSALGTHKASSSASSQSGAHQQRGSLNMYHLMSRLQQQE